MLESLGASSNIADIATVVTGGVERAFEFRSNVKLGDVIYAVAVCVVFLQASPRKA